MERIVLHSRVVENRGKRGGAYDLGGAKQRTARNVKKKNEARIKKGGE